MVERAGGGVTGVIAANDELQKDPWPTAETWGTDPAAQRAQQAMMQLAGGPAPLRGAEEGAG